MSQHTGDDSCQATSMSAQFIEKFAIAGSAEYCMRELQALIVLGLDIIFLV